MVRVNTTSGVVETLPRRAPDAPHGKVNTTRVYEEDLIDLDGDDVLHCVAAAGWHATFEDGTALPLVCWAIRESDRGHGVIVEQSGASTAGVVIDASKDVSKEPGFVGYIHRGGK